MEGKAKGGGGGKGYTHFYYSIRGAPRMGRPPCAHYHPPPLFPPPPPPRCDPCVCVRPQPLLFDYISRVLRQTRTPEILCRYREWI